MEAHSFLIPFDFAKEDGATEEQSRRQAVSITDG